MEAIARADGGAIAGYSFSRRDFSTPSSTGKRNLLSPGTNCNLSSLRGNLRMVRRSPFSSDTWHDQSHLQYYFNVQHDVRKDKLTNSVSRKAITSLDEAVDDERVRHKAVAKARKTKMKMQMKLNKASMACASSASSSSSPSSSESEAEDTTAAGAQRKRVNMDEWRRDWACISQSPLLNSIPTISNSFVIEQPAAAPYTNPVERWSAAQQAEVTSSADLMATRISSAPGSHMGFSSGRFLMAGAPAPQSPPAEAARLEVCMGGKCKKAGAQEVLAAFQANGMDASACNKCMKKCKFAVNVRVRQDDDDGPQMYSGIGVQDVNSLSRKHFGVRTASRAATEV